MAFRLISMLKGKCPHCERSGVFEKKPFFSVFRMPRMKKVCASCGHVFEKENGFFWGAMFVSYALTVLELVFILIGIQFFFQEKMDPRMIWIAAASILLLSPFNFRMSRLIWLYIFTPPGNSYS
jgi:uncharacterized protein (DUF983 family)